MTPASALSRGARAAWGLALLVPIVFALAFPAVSIDDTQSYLGPARGAAEGHGFTVSGQPMEQRLPLYPALLAAAIFLFGDGPVTFGLLNAVCHLLSVVLVRRGLKPGALRDALGAAALVYPPALTSSGLVLQESALELSFALIFLAAVRALEAPTSGRALSLGLSVGLSALGKTTVLPAGALIGLLVLIQAGRARRTAPAVAFVLGISLCLGPWAVRNGFALGRFQFSNGNGGANLLASTVSTNIVDWSNFREMVDAQNRWEGGERRRVPVLDAYLYEVGWKRIREDPGRWVALGVERAFRFMLPARHWFVARGYSESATISLGYVLAAVVQGVLFICAGLLAVRAFRSRKPTAADVVPILVFGHQLVYAALYSSPRYAVPLLPLLFAGVGMVIQHHRGPGDGEESLRVQPRTRRSPNSPVSSNWNAVPFLRER